MEKIVPRDVHLEKLYKLLLAGEKFGPAMRKVGVWSDDYTRTPARLKSSKKYNRFINRKMATIDNELKRILEAMAQADLSEERHHDLVQSYERLMKVKLLLESKPTEITETTVRLLTDAELDARIRELNGETESSDDAGVGEAEEGEVQA